MVVKKMNLEELRIIEEFPDYVVDRDGRVYSLKSGQERRSSLTRMGAVKITLYKDGVQQTRSLAKIVANAYVYNNHDPEIFQTPIHLNNNLQDNRAENLMWRPRWFATKYQNQYWRRQYRFAKESVIDEQTGEIYHTIMDACQTFGLLYVDVLNSCLSDMVCFPTFKRFSYLN